MLKKIKKKFDYVGKYNLKQYLYVMNRIDIWN